MQVEVPEWVKNKRSAPLSSTGRMQHHVGELARSLADRQRAVLLVCCIYDNPGFKVVERSTNYDEVKATVDASVARGVEVCQANFRIAPDGVTLQKVVPVAFREDHISIYTARPSSGTWAAAPFSMGRAEVVTQ